MLHHIDEEELINYVCPSILKSTAYVHSPLKLCDNNNNNNMCKSFAIFFLANGHIQTLGNDGKRINEMFVCVMMFYNPLLL